MPLAAPVSDTHETFEFALHSHVVDEAVNVTELPPAAAPIETVGGATEKVHADAVFPACVTLNVCPAIDSRPVRGAAELLGATMNWMVAVPVPLAPPAANVNHVESLAAVHAQPAAAFTATDPVPPAAGMFWFAMARVTLHDGATGTAGGEGGAGGAGGGVAAA